MPGEIEVGGVVDEEDDRGAVVFQTLEERDLVALNEECVRGRGVVEEVESGDVVVGPEKLVGKASSAN